MNPLRLQDENGSAVAIYAGEQLLCRYVYVSKVAHQEAPRPYFHPLNSLAGDTLTNFRPNDHPWHHGLSFTLTQVSGANFWGGPTRRPEDGYKHRDDQGEQRHVAWKQCEARGASATLAHSLEWHTPAALMFREEREIVITLDAGGASWSLRWRTRLANASGRELSIGNPHSAGGLPGSHYTGLQFRGKRELLDDHLDPTIKITAEGGLEGEKTVHGALAQWMEWHGQVDGTLHRVTLRFENNAGPLRWFVRRNYPLATFPVQFDQDRLLAPGDSLEADHTLTFTSQ